MKNQYEKNLWETQALVSKLERWLVVFVLFYTFVNAMFYHFEKMFFWGEFCVLLTIMLIKKIPYTAPKKYQTELLMMVAIWLFLFPIYGLLMSKFYWSQVFAPKYLIRHAVFFYYGVFFFFAFKYASLILFYFKKYAKWILIIVTFGEFFMGTNSSGFHPLIGFMLMALAQHKEKLNLFYAGLVLAFAMLFSMTGAGTNKFVLLFFAAFFTLNFIARFWTKFIPVAINRILLFLLFASSAILFVKFLSGFYQLTTQMAMLGDGIGTLEPMSTDFKTDLGGFWRFVLWSHLYGRFIDHPWGVGLGTPLFEGWLDGFVMLNLWKEGENYVQGAHNSFITFIVRLGIPCLILFTLILYYIVRLSIQVFKKLGYRPLQTEEGRLLTGSFLAFGSICITSCFNVVLESPLYAGIFWFSFGLFTKLFGDALAYPSSLTPPPVLAAERAFCPRTGGGVNSA